MKILLTGATGYIGQHLLSTLLEKGHHIVALVRSANRLPVQDRVEVVEGDLLDFGTIGKIPSDVDAAYYLVHSLAQGKEKLMELEVRAAENFLRLIESTEIRQVIYLSGLAGEESLSPHLLSRKRVEEVLRGGKTPVTTLRAGIIIGSGSASFEIMRDLVEKLPVMVAPRWVKSKCQPIWVFDVLDYLVGVLDHPDCLGKTFDIGGPDILSYKEMLLKVAEVRGLRRCILTVPVLTPRLSSYWLFFVTSTNFVLASSLVESLKNNAVCSDKRIHNIIPKTCLSFEEALHRTFSTIKVPKRGCFTNVQEVPFTCDSKRVLDTVWEIGGERGWYFMNWAWAVRGWIDQLFMGAGLRRGRTHPTQLRPGDALDFWRVVVADRNQGRLLLYAEMRLPGEAWLEFEVLAKNRGGTLHQQATFRPKGLLGRMYWYGIYPIHVLIFRGMCRGIVRYAQKRGEE